MSCPTDWQKLVKVIDPLATPEGGPEILKEAEVKWKPEDANSQTDVLFYFSKPQQSL